MKKILSGTLAVILSLILQIPVIGVAYATTSSDLLGGEWTIYSTDSAATVSWDIPVVDGKVLLYRDGVLVSSDDEKGSFEVPDVQPSEDLSFSIEVNAPLGQDQALKISKEESIPVDAVKVGFEQIAVSGMSLQVPSQGNAGVSSASAATSWPTTTNLRYQTFIPNVNVPAPAAGVCNPIDGMDYRFAGDNRSFNANASSFRSRFDVNIHWSTGTTSAIRLVGQTRREVYDSATASWFFDATKTASNSGMTYTALSGQSSTFTSFNMHHEVRNPLCVASLTNAIYYDLDFDVYRSGTFVISGVTILVPNHELYIRDSDTTAWTTIFQRSTKTMDCLSPIYALLGTCSKTLSTTGTR